MGMNEPQTYTSTEGELPLMFSADDHVVEPPDLWTKRVPKKYRDVAPKVIRKGQPTWRDGARRIFGEATDEGAPCDYWLFEGLLTPIIDSQAGAGIPSTSMKRAGITFDDMRPGCYDPRQRLDDMDINGVEYSLCFPNFLPRFCGQRFLETEDKELAHFLLKAYNDWMIEDWCGPADGRLIPLCLIPLWDPKLAAQEIYRNAERGARAISFSELPTRLGLPSIHDKGRYWDPVFAACNETSTVICIHLHSSSTVVLSSEDAPGAVGSSCSMSNAALCLSDWVFSGNFDRFSELRIVLSEAEIGWIPYILERNDAMWALHPMGYDASKVTKAPSEYFREHFYGSFIRDQHGIDSLDSIGADNVLFEADYPHADSTWPHTAAVAKNQMSGLDDDVIRKILRGNAMKLFGVADVDRAILQPS